MTNLNNLADQWERLADVFADGTHCPGCMFYEHGVSPTRTPWRECSCLLPAHCPMINRHSVAALFPKQAT
jgi:hypothetical protein